MALASTDHSIGASTEQAFLIGQSNGGGSSGPLAVLAAEAAQAFGAPLTPWGAVAAVLHDPGKSVVSVCRRSRGCCALRPTAAHLLPSAVTWKPSNVSSTHHSNFPHLPSRG